VDLEILFPQTQHFLQPRFVAPQGRGFRGLGELRQQRRP
jgi:hypothetical protein